MRRAVWDVALENAPLSVLPVFQLGIARVDNLMMLEFPEQLMQCASPNGSSTVTYKKCSLSSSNTFCASLQQ